MRSSQRTGYVGSPSNWGKTQRHAISLSSSDLNRANTLDRWIGRLCVAAVLIGLGVVLGRMV
jgi:hypothetical protein